MKILIVDNCKFTCNLLTTSFQSNGFEVEFAPDSDTAVRSAIADPPELIVIDMKIPPLGSTHLTKQIKADRQLSEIPIIILGSSNEIDFKLESFQAGASDFLSKPFNFQELFARICCHIRRSVKIPEESEQEQDANVIGIHSLQGGVGCSTAAVNIALILKLLWNANTLLVDAVPWAGQVGLLLNLRLQNTWAALDAVDESGLDADVATKLIGTHQSGLDYLLAPFSVEEDMSKLLPKLNRGISCLKPLYDYIVIDLDSTFSSGTSMLIENCTSLVHVVAANVPSVSASSLAFKGYRQRNLSNESIVILGNQTVGHHGLKKSTIEKALDCSVDSWMPWMPREFSMTTNEGVPIALSHPNLEATHAYQDLALLLSKERHLQICPASPSEMWRQFQQRHYGLVAHPVVRSDDKNGASRVLDLFSSWF